MCIRDSHYAYQIHQAIVCGSPVSRDNPIYRNFVSLGIIHLLIASGAHLQFIKKGLSPVLFFKQTYNKLLLNIVTGAYVLVTGLNPPLVRAYLNQIIKQTTTKLYWRPTVCVLVSAALSLLLKPSLWGSYSLMLSWSVCSLLTVNCSALKRCTLIYFGTLPFIMQFQWVHPISIFANLFLAPLFALIYFPISFLSLFSSAAEQFSWSLWETTSNFLTTFTMQLETQYTILSFSKFSLWIYCFSIQAAVMVCNQKKLRRLYFK